MKCYYTDGYDTTDGPYLEAVSETLEVALSRWRPDLLLYVAGADPYEADRLGRLKVTKKGCPNAMEL